MDDFILLFHRLMATSWIILILSEVFLAKTSRSLSDNDLQSRIDTLKKISNLGRAVGMLLSLSGLGLIFVVGNYDINEPWVLVKITMVLGAIALGAILNGKRYKALEEQSQDFTAVKSHLGSIALNSSLIFGLAATAVFSALIKFGS